MNQATSQPSSQSVSQSVNAWMNEWVSAGFQNIDGCGWVVKSTLHSFTPVNRSIEHQWKWKWMLMLFDPAFSSAICVWPHHFNSQFFLSPSLSLALACTLVIFCSYLRGEKFFSSLPFSSTHRKYKAWSLISLLFLIILCIATSVCVCILVFCYFVLFLSPNKAYHLRRVSSKKHSRQFRCVIYRRHLVCRIVCIWLPIQLASAC